MDIQKEVLKYKEQLISSLQESIQIKSVEEEPKSGMPFGEGPAKALQHFLKVGENLGFKVENFDNYAGHIIFGEGEESLGILGHVDVVPEGTGWDYPPYSGMIVDNKMYGRGTLDDKGPLMICLYAMKYLKDMGIPLKKQIRMIVGANEETEWGCMKHYFNTLKMPEPTLSFTPDSSFPVTFAEKGILRGLLKIKCDDNFSIQGGKVFNAVPEKTFLTLPLEYKNLIIEELEKYNFENEYKITCEEKNNKLEIISYGKAAHAAHPELGYNSLSALLSFIYAIGLKVTGLSEMAKYFGENIKLEFNGKSAGLYFKDEPSGEITMNYGKAYVEDGYLYVSLDTRYPVTVKVEELENKLFVLLNKYGIEFVGGKKENPLYIKKDSFLVQELTNIYKEITNDKDCEPVAIGGGTYAKAVKNCVAFGALLKETPDTMHQKNECIPLDTLDTLLKIYVEAIYRLAK